MHITKLDNITYRLGYNGYIVLLSQNERLKRPIIKRLVSIVKKYLVFVQETGLNKYFLVRSFVLDLKKLRKICFVVDFFRICPRYKDERKINKTKTKQKRFFPPSNLT